LTTVHGCDKQAVKKVATDLEKSVEPIDGQKMTKVCQPEVMKVSKTSLSELKQENVRTEKGSTFAAQLLYVSVGQKCNGRTHNKKVVGE